MLVLTRKPAEIIRIGEDIVIKVIKTGKGTVKIGIEAPSNVRVMRGELVEDEAPGHPGLFHCCHASCLRPVPACGLI